MISIKVALLGLGTVGKGVYETIETHQQKLTEATGLPVEVVAILVKDANKQRNINNTLVTTRVEEILAIDGLDIVFEAIVGIEPANTFIKRFIEKGCHVISANKELLAHKGQELTAYAQQHQRFLVFEAAVAGGIPLLRTIIQLLQVNGIQKLEGILNGTSNYILSKMRKERISFQNVLNEAQQLGFAEADPSNDILGTDAFYKLMILSNLIHQQQPNWSDVEKIGIENVNINDLLLGEKLGFRLKLLASLTRVKGEVHGEVKPAFVSKDHPLYNVEGVDNGIVLTTDLVGTILLQGPGAGSKATASAMIEDLVFIKQQGLPKQDTPRYSYNGGSETRDKEGSTIWLCISKPTHSEKIKSNFGFTSKLEKYNLTLLDRETLKTTEGYVTGDLIQGRAEEVLQYQQNTEVDHLRFYPVSLTGLDIQAYEYEKLKLQTTTL